MNYLTSLRAISDLGSHENKKCCSNLKFGEKHCLVSIFHPTKKTLADVAIKRLKVGVKMF